MAKITIVKDIIAEKIDELAELGECWRILRKKGTKPQSVKGAILSLVNEIKLILEQESKDAVQKQEGES